MSDAMATGLGAWCLLLGALWLLASTGGATADGVWARAAQVLVIATLYSLTHTWDLLFFGAQVVWLVPLVWLAGNAKGTPRTYSSVFGLGAGALCLVGALLLIGRATGGQYSLGELSLSALTQWPLALVAIGAALWLGLAPFTGWSAQGHGRAATGILQTLVVGMPMVMLVLRLQQLVTVQGLAGSVPEGWAGFTAALAWAGAITALVAGAGTLVHAGTARRSGALTAFVSGLVAWGLGLDTPAGRFAALAILAAYGLGRVTLELVDRAPGDRARVQGWRLSARLDWPRCRSLGYRSRRASWAYGCWPGR